MSQEDIEDIKLKLDCDGCGVKIKVDPRSFLRKEGQFYFQGYCNCGTIVYVLEDTTSGKNLENRLKDLEELPPKS